MSAIREGEHVTIGLIGTLNTALAALAVTTALSTGVVAAESVNAKTRTPIEHLVVIFLENHTFDNYFATYPNAANPKGEPQFVAADDTPTVNGLTAGLLTNNPNVANPQRLDRVATTTTATATSRKPSTAGLWTTSICCRAPTIW